MAAYKDHLKDLFFEAIFRLGISSPKKIAADNWLILTFHRVLPEPLRSQYPLPGLAVTPQALHWIIETLRPHFEILPVTEGFRRWSGEKRDRPILSVSFDDGQLDNFQYAAPVLDELQVAGTFYLPTDFIGSAQLLWHDHVAFACRSTPDEVGRALEEHDPGATVNPGSVGRVLALLKSLSSTQRQSVLDRLTSTAKGEVPDWARLMTWDDAGKLAGSGHEIGSHSQSHALLPQLAADDLTREVAGSKDDIVSRLGSCSPDSFCYPNGDFSAETLSAVDGAGYSNAVTTRWGINAPGQDRYQLLRCDMDMRRLANRHGALSRARLSVKLTGHQPGL